MNRGFRAYGEVNFSDRDFLWRYMDPQKFLYFILSHSLHFTRLDMLNDSLEGITASELIGRMDPELISEYGAYKNTLFDTNASPSKSTLIEQIEQLKFRQKRYFVNCWFLSTRESFAMWSLYGGSSSVVLRVKPEKLVALLKNEKAHQLRQDRVQDRVYGMVSYKDYRDKKAISDRSFKQTYAAFRKDLSWEHEREFRAVICSKRDKHELDDGPLEIGLPSSGVDLKIMDLLALDISVIFHPDMSEWVKRDYRILTDRLNVKGLRFQDSELVDNFIKES